MSSLPTSTIRQKSHMEVKNLQLKRKPETPNQMHIKLVVFYDSIRTEVLVREQNTAAMMQQSMSTSLQPRDSLSSSGMLINKSSQVDYSKYVKKFASSVECGSTYCKDLNYREHFHCLDCNSRVFIKKEEMIRHFKWHKKRDESLQHGFMRYSPLDDCSDKFSNCTHNKKQTHYHCIQENCDKVYISTSDVQMHSNYHRKDSAIMQEGFQRSAAY
ncbi:hypothetical protein HUJ05_007582 [Dendroctonus ponderosae]|nr:hypothetical protein HUJ05_007582 [Dendroctonus ponderosae]